jgi:hypothetical protein
MVRPNPVVEGSHEGNQQHREISSIKGGLVSRLVNQDHSNGRNVGLKAPWTFPRVIAFLFIDLLDYLLQSPVTGDLSKDNLAI